MENITSSKLFTTRQGTILLGVIAAVIAAIALIVYLNQYRNSHSGNAAISVLVAQKLIQKGTPGDVNRTKDGVYTATSILKGQIESCGVVDRATADFGPATTNSVINHLGRDQRAVVVTLGSPEQVGGQIAAGSHVDVWVSGTNQSARNGANTQTVALLYQNMDILGVSGGNTTFRATPTQAGKLIWASQNANIYLVLRPTVGSVTKPTVISNLGR